MRPPVREEPDDTVRLRVSREGARPPAAPWKRAAPVAAAAGLFAIGGGGAAWWLWPTAPAARVEPAAFVAPSPPPSPPIEKPRPDAAEQAATAAPPMADEAQILSDAPQQLAVYRFGPRPAVVVLQFPTLAEQAAMLNRIAALVEKAGFPHDKVVSRAALDAQIIAEGGSPDTFYYGHDYRSADVLRFFDLATDLDPGEQRLRDMVQRFGWREQGAAGAVISLVRASNAQGLDPAGRAAILRHELSHGVYFTDPAYAEFCRHFWRDTLSAEERAKFTAFLGREGYDTSLTDLLINETQAYLMHTPDHRFFSAAEVGLSPIRVVELRQVFLIGMPPGWLRDHTAVDTPP